MNQKYVVLGLSAATVAAFIAAISNGVLMQRYDNYDSINYLIVGGWSLAAVIGTIFSIVWYQKLPASVPVDPKTKPLVIPTVVTVDPTVPVDPSLTFPSAKRVGELRQQAAAMRKAAADLDKEADTVISLIQAELDAAKHIAQVTT